ncbi:MAG: ECF-type sigma factor [Acidobacteriota bacterium]|nr:ECF-type sigma factor [Acidobacteriota bacterium]
MRDETARSARDQGEVTRLLQRWKGGDQEVVDELLPLVYQELRVLAGNYLRRERAGHTLPPTALVHEAYLRLVGSDLSQATIENRTHFFAVAAQAMRRILVEHARYHAAARRPSPAQRMPFEEADAEEAGSEAFLDVLAVHESLQQLQENHPRQARVVELRFFGGLAEDEAAQVLGVSRATVARDWRIARMLLGRMLQAPRAPMGTG